MSSLLQVLVDDLECHCFDVDTEEFVQAQLLALRAIFSHVIGNQLARLAGGLLGRGLGILFTFLDHAAAASAAEVASVVIVHAETTGVASELIDGWHEVEIVCG